MDRKPDILFIGGSPRKCTTVALVGLIERGVREAGARTQRFLLSEKTIRPCTACNGCLETGICVLAGDHTKSDRFDDDYLELKGLLDRVDAVVVVAPIYFAGPPAQLKALYDRFQPYWVKRYVLGEEPPPKRPAQLFMVGGGSDPHGFEPLAAISRSALAVAGFSLDKVSNFIGFLAPSEAPVELKPGSDEDYSLAQIAQTKRALVKQAEFEQRAIDAGGAFARSVLRKMNEGKMNEAEPEKSAPLPEVPTSREDADAANASKESTGEEDVDIRTQDVVADGSRSDEV